MADKLNAGDIFPRMAIEFTDGSSRELPAQLEQPWNVVLFYRGHW